MCKCPYLGMYTMYMLGTLGGQKGASFALALELRVLVSYHPLGPRNQTRILCKSKSDSPCVVSSAPGYGHGYVILKENGPRTFVPSL